MTNVQGNPYIQYWNCLEPFLEGKGDKVGSCMVAVQKVRGICTEHHGRGPIYGTVCEL